MFRFMEKYKIQILLVVLFAMVGFGAWGFVGDLISGSGDNVDPDEVWATVDIFGEEVPVTQADVWRNNGNEPFRGNEDAAASVIGHFILKEVARSEHGYPVSDNELQLALKERIKGPLSQFSGGEFDQKTYADFCANFYKTPAQFEEMLREELNVSKTWREYSRAGTAPSLLAIFERARKENQLIRLKGIFWDTAQYEEAAKLDRDSDGNLTPSSIEALRAYFDGLTKEERQQLSTKGAMITTDFIGYDFKLHESDEDFVTAFTRVEDASGKSLDQITSEIKVSPEDVTIMKTRLERMRSAYGLAETDEIEKVYEERQARFESEIRILKHVNALWEKLNSELKAGQEIDLAKAATDNNLTYFKWEDRYLRDLSVDSVAFQSNELYQLQLVSNKVGELVNLRHPPGSEGLYYGSGAVDAPARHIAIFRLLDRDMQPEAKFTDPEVRDTLVTRLEKKRAVDARDAAFKSFDDRMNEIMTELAKDKIAEIEKKAAEELAELNKDLDPEKEEDKAIIDKTAEDKKAETDLLIEEAKSEHRDVAFKQTLEEMPDAGLVVEEGFFRPQDSTREQPADREASFEARARSALRRDFKGLHDDAIIERVIEPGTVSATFNSTTYPGLKGIAVLVEKKTMSDRQLMLRPELLETAYRNTYYALIKERGPLDIFKFESMQKRNFDLDPGRFVDQIKKEEERKAEAAKRDAEFQAEMRRREAEMRERQANESSPDADAAAGKTRALSTTPNK